jgi:hypothetical protein
MTTLRINDIKTISSITELSDQEIADVSGGILCLGILAFAAGYAVGTAINAGIDYVLY